MRLRDKSGVYPGRVYLDDQWIPTYCMELYVEPLKGQYISVFTVYCTLDDVSLILVHVY